LEYATTAVPFAFFALIIYSNLLQAVASAALTCNYQDSLQQAKGLRFLLKFPSAY
jgi:hypothetical protein